MTYCIAQETLLNILWENNLKKNRSIYMHNNQFAIYLKLTIRDRIKKKKLKFKKQETIWSQIKGMQVLYTTWSLSANLSLNFCYKIPPQIPPSWDTQFQGHEPILPRFA